MKNKKSKKKTIICTAATALLLITVCVLMYINSPRYIIKNTVMWYEKDFTLPLFCQKIKFEYNRENGNYTGKFQISERDAYRLWDKLDAAESRASSAQNAMMRAFKRQVHEALKEEIMNATGVVNLFYTLKEFDIEPEKIYPEDWMVEEDAEICAYYCTLPRYIEGVTLFQDTLGGREPYCYVIIYKNKDDQYYLCIKRTDFSDWDGPGGK